MGMDKQKDKLNAEELEKRVAPVTLVYSEPTEEPAPDGGGGGDVVIESEQPGNSGPHRNKEYKFNE